jgi:hypothetical protein
LDSNAPSTGRIEQNYRPCRLTLTPPIAALSAGLSTGRRANAGRLSACRLIVAFGEA